MNSDKFYEMKYYKYKAKFVKLQNGGSDNTYPHDTESDEDGGTRFYSLLPIDENINHEKWLKSENTRKRQYYNNKRNINEIQALIDQNNTQCSLLQQQKKLPSPKYNFQDMAKYLQEIDNYERRQRELNTSIGHLQQRIINLNLEKKRLEELDNDLR